MGAAWKIFLMGMGQVVRDGMLLLLLPAPFLMGVALRFILPSLDGILGREFNFTDKTYSFTDATTFAAMERLGITSAFTFDRHYIQYGFGVWNNLL